VVIDRSVLSDGGGKVMRVRLLAPVVWLQVMYPGYRDRLMAVLRDGWEDDTGTLDESTAKLIWLGAAVAVSLAAVAFAITIYNGAKGHVPTPTETNP
jgi:hypothetical protein